MIRTIEAEIDDQGNIRLLETIRPGSARRALVLIFDEPGVHFDEPAMLSENALGDWNRPEEDEAWSYLQPVK